MIVWTMVFSLLLCLPSGIITKADQPQEVIVVFKHDVDSQALAKANASIQKKYDNFPIIKARLSEKGIAALANNPNIVSIEPDSIITMTADTLEWGVARVQAPTAWNAGYTGINIKVAVIDTGIALHPDLTIEGGANFVATASSYYDDNGHGTHVAGIIAAKINGLGVIGVAPDAKLYSVKVLSSSGSGYLSDVVSGIDWSITNNMDIINMSLGSSTDSPAMKTAIDTAYYGHGILVVASAGNSGTLNTRRDNVGYPAKYDSVIAVAATDINNNRASFSSTGPAVEVAAPGVSIRSTYLNNGYATLSGTSMSAPHVAGHLALMKQAFPTLSAASLRIKLQEYTLDLGTIGKDNLYGYGLIQTFIEASSQITIQYQPTIGGSVSRTSETLDPQTGTAQGSIASANAGYHFVHWIDGSGNIVTTDTTWIPQKVDGVYVSATYTAVFVENDAITITYQATIGGDVDPTSETLAPVTGVASGSTATAQSGYRFVSWTDASDMIVGTDPYFIPPKIDGLNVSATYRANFEVYEPVELRTFTKILMASEYIAGSKILITVEVSNGIDPIAGASIVLTIIPPSSTKSRTIITTLSTAMDGKATYTMNTNKNSIKGTYTVVAETSYPDYQSSSDQTTFLLK